MAYSHIAHDCQVGSHTIFANGASLAGHVVVAEHAILGGFTLVHQFCRIGAHTMTALGTIVLKDIPPYVTAAGNPAVPHGINTRGLKRRGFSDSEIAATKRAYRTIYKSGMKLEQAIDEVKKSCGEVDTVKHFIDFIKTSERGIVR
jgi:UDP-N-acetylglucosamine acyltransferase